MRTRIGQSAGTACLLLATSMGAFALTPTFAPDVTFKGSTLQGWHTLGESSWRAKDGELTGTGEGWLVLDRSYQDVAFFASFLAEPGAKTGVLLRAEKTPEGGLRVFTSTCPKESSARTLWCWMPKAAK
jgi:hypothetical protein